MSALLLLAAAALAQPGIVTWHSQRRVQALRSEGGRVGVWTEGGAYWLAREGRGWARTARPEPFVGPAEPEAPARLGACEYRPTEDGVLEVCGARRRVRSAGGLPVNATAVFRGTVYAGTFGGGLRRLDGRGPAVPGLHPVVTALAVHEGRLWVGTEGGLYAYDGSKVEALPWDGPLDENISSLELADGALWVGTFDQGLSRLSSGAWRHWTERDGLPSAWVDELRWDGRRLWVATEKGVGWLEDDRARLPPAELRGKAVGLRRWDGRVWLAREDGLWAAGAGKPRRLEFPKRMKGDNAQDLLLDEGGAWVAGLRGLYRVPWAALEGGKEDGVRHLRTLDGTLHANWVTALGRLNGRLLAGTYDAGLAELDAKKAAGAEVRVPGIWVNPRAIAVQGERAAVGTMGDGLWLRREGEWTRLTRKDGLAGDDVTAVLFDGDWLWVGTRTGLSRVSLGSYPTALKIGPPQGY